MLRCGGVCHCFTSDTIPGCILLNVKQQLVEMNLAHGAGAFGRVHLRDDVPRIVTTQQFDWPSLRVEAGINNVAAVDEVAGLHHYVSLNVDDRPITLEVKGELGDFRRVVLRRGAAWVCPADDVVSVRLNSNFRYVRMSIDPVYFDRVVTADSESPVQLRRSYGIVEPQIAHIAGALIAESDAGNPGGLAFVEALATGLSHQMALHAGVRKPIMPRLRGGLSTVAKRRALELMDANLDSNLSVEFLAGEVELSPAHFARAFRETFGLPPHRYLLHLRLERARHLLDGENAVLADVAQRVGFADQAHFTRFFKREYGVTPGIVMRSRRRMPAARK
jgi:AraC family transcriptional regulator